MKKIKLLTSLVGLTGLSMGLVPMISGCSCSKSNVELDESVTKQKISIKSEHIVQGEDSTIEFNLPSGKTISKITLKIGDTEVTEANVTIKGNKVTIPASKMISGKVIVKKIVLEQPKDFVTCEWSEINEWCTKLENGDINVKAFCAHFANGTTPITSMDDFVGLERTIKINNNDHVIRVIGTQHDTIVEDGKVTKKKATLTFELVTLMSQENGTRMGTWWHTKSENFNYTDSLLRANLNGKHDGMTTDPDWSKTAIDLLPPEVKAIIKTVNKEVAISTDSGTSYNTTKYNDMLFPLTYTEMDQKSAKEEAPIEGSPYKYWQDPKNQTNDKRIKRSYKRTPSTYWLASPDTTITTRVYVIKDTGQYGTEYAYNVSFAQGVSFAFCI